MNGFDQVFTFRFARPREFLHCAADGRLYEVVRVPPFCEDLLATKSPLLADVARTFEDRNAVYCCFRFSLSRCLEFVLLKNAPLEETYVALIIRAVADLVVQLHARGLFGVGLSPANLTLCAGGKIAIRNRFSLNCHSKREADDWTAFCQFVERIAPADARDDKATSTSRSFRLFLKTLEACRNREGPVAAKFAELLAHKFLNQKPNILDDLLDDADPMGDAEARKLVPVQVRPVDTSEQLEAAGNPFDLSGERGEGGAGAEEERKRELFTKAMTAVFEKYRKEDYIRGKQGPLNLLTAIENALKTMDSAEPFAALQLMRQMTGAHK